MNSQFRKSSCSDLQSRLKVRKVLGVGGETSGSTCSSKISQILGQSDHYVFQLPPKLATWLIIITIYFSSFTLMVIESAVSILFLFFFIILIFIRRVFSVHHVYGCFCREILNRHYIWQLLMPVGDERLIYFLFSFTCQTLFLPLIFVLVLSTILALTLRSGDKICLQLVLFSLVCFHGLSLFSELNFFFLNFFPHE